MDENKRFELAEFLRELKEEKRELEEKVKGLNSEIEDITAELVADLIENESTGFNHKGYNFTLVVKEYPSPQPETKEELYARFKAQGFDGLFSINANTLAATVKELKTENDGQLPDWLEGLIKVHEKSTIQIRKGRSV